LPSLSKPHIKRFSIDTPRYLDAIKKISPTSILPSLYSLVTNPTVIDQLENHFHLYYPGVDPDSLSSTEFLDCLFSLNHSLVRSAIAMEAGYEYIMMNQTNFPDLNDYFIFHRDYALEARFYEPSLVKAAGFSKKLYQKLSHPA
jgi:hypothetical protein